jgi:CTP synthase (UTP-ammonia lyase)
VASAHLIIAPAACPVPGRPHGAPSLHGPAAILIRRGTRAWDIYGRDNVEERYFCNYEVNPAYRGALEAAGLALSGFSESGAVRMAELPGHPFFLATLFQPQLSSQPGKPHPLITAFVRACAARSAAAA